MDAGRAVSVESNIEVDYRGKPSEFLAVSGLSLADLVAEYKNVDYVHIDVQGTESVIIPRSVEALERHVRYMFIGTHSRKIEGDIIDLLISRSWRLIKEQPCVFDPLASSPSLAGLTRRDGGQFWGSPSA